MFHVPLYARASPKLTAVLTMWTGTHRLSTLPCIPPTGHASPGLLAHGGQGQRAPRIYLQRQRSLALEVIHLLGNIYPSVTSATETISTRTTNFCFVSVAVRNLLKPAKPMTCVCRNICSNRRIIDQLAQNCAVLPWRTTSIWNRCRSFLKGPDFHIQRMIYEDSERWRQHEYPQTSLRCSLQSPGAISSRLRISDPNMGVDNKVEVDTPLSRGTLMWKRSE